jgi:hypothetical protein
MRNQADRALADRTGYGAFAVSFSTTDQVQECGRHQEEHHRGVSFQEEVLLFIGVQVEDGALGTGAGAARVQAGRQQGPVVRIRVAVALRIRKDRRQPVGGLLESEYPEVGNRGSLRAVGFPHVARTSPAATCRLAVGARQPSVVFFDVVQQLAGGVLFDLPHALARQADRLPDLLERHALAVTAI